MAALAGGRRNQIEATFRELQRSSPRLAADMSDGTDCETLAWALDLQDLPAPGRQTESEA